VKKSMCFAFRRLKSLLAIFFFSVAIPWGVLSYTPVSELIPSGHWVYDAISLVALDSGVTTLAVNAPISCAEFRTHLLDIDYERLSGSGKALYNKVLRWLDDRSPLMTSGFATADVKPELSLSGKYVQNEDARFSFDRQLDYNETAPLISLPLLLGFSPYVSAFADFSVGEGYWASTLDSSSTNIPSSASSFDLNVPSTAYVSTGNSFFTAALGRGQLNIGESLSGSMILSDTSDRLNYGSLSLFSPSLRLYIMPIELDTDRYAYYHGVSFRPIKSLSITFSESSLVNSTLDLRYLNPAMVFHSYAGWRDSYGDDDDSSNVGSELGLLVDFVPVRGVRLYGQFVMNQFQTEYELKTYSSSASVIPNSLGGLAGVEYLQSLDSGFLKISLEGVYTNPWLYILENHAISYYASRKELVAPSGYSSEEIETWLGSPYGPDTLACTLSCEYFALPSWSLGVSYRYLLRGENGDSFLSNLTDTYYPSTVEEADESTPTGDAKYQHTFTLFASRYLTESLEVSGKLGYILLIDDQFENSIISSCSLTWNIR
jgi:hypothetical protein